MYLFFFYKNIFYEIIEADILLKRTQLILCLKICKLSTIHVFILTVYHGYVKKKLTSFSQVEAQICLAAHFSNYCNYYNLQSVYFELVVLT